VVPLILSELEQAQSRVDVAMFYLSSDALVDALCKLSAERGIEVRVLADSDMDQTATRPVLEKLHDYGVDVIVVEPPGSGKLHHKSAVVDGKVVLTGAANWSEAAGQSNHEDVMALYSPVLAAKYLAHFDKIEATGKPLGGPRPSKVARRPRRRLPRPRRNQPGQEVKTREIRVYFTPDRQGVLKDLLPMLKQARTVDVGMYLLTDRDLLSTLEEIASNATVRVIVDEDTLAGRGLGRLQKLWDAGIQVVSFHKDRAAMHLPATGPAMRSVAASRISCASIHPPWQSSIPKPSVTFSVSANPLRWRRWLSPRPMERKSRAVSI